MNLSMGEPVELEDDEARCAAEHRYETSEHYIPDALQWVADHGHEDSRVVAVACAAYSESSQYATRISDIVDGEFTP